MNKSREGSTEPNQRQPLRRFAQRLGLAAIETKAVEASQRITTERPEVAAFDPRRTSLIDYADLNASRAGMDDSVLKRVRELQVLYGADPAAERLPYNQPGPAEYGFSRRHPKVVFKWNLDETSREVSRDILYVVGASPSSEPIAFDAHGIQRISQEYTSAVGLNFIDTRDTTETGPRSNYHELYVYLPSADDLSPANV